MGVQPMIKLQCGTIILSLLMLMVDANSYKPPELETKPKVLDCTKKPSEICKMNFTVAPFMSMSYYDILHKERRLRGYRGYFNTSGNFELLPVKKPPDNINALHPPITVDGEFRPLITINGHMPGPTIIAMENQTLHITVYNELPNVEGISIHWHGMHQKRRSHMDGVAFISQLPILTHQSFTYKFDAFPNGTHWYHAHSGAHRTDGLYGALIVKEELRYDLYDEDKPEDHTLLLMDWQKDPSIDLFYQIRSSITFYTKEHARYNEVRAIDGTQVAPIPFWSGIINDKGRHFNESYGRHNYAQLNRFSVVGGKRYRFRLIGAQALYAYKFSIENHKLTVIATDGNYIENISEVNYVIVNTGERYDVIVNANNTIRNYWILAETLEDRTQGANSQFYNPIEYHKAEAVLHYEGASQHSPSEPSATWDCVAPTLCRYVNCPYNLSTENIKCINVEEFRDPLQRAVQNPLLHSNNITTLFYNFGFDGEKSTRGSSVDGINFRFPSVLPSAGGFDANVCPGRGCDHDTKKHCACTHVIDISQSFGKPIDLVLTNYPEMSESPESLCPKSPESPHPVHLHGHSFFVIKVGYPNYHDNGTYMSPNEDIECIVEGDGTCENFITVHTTEKDGKRIEKQNVRWKNGRRPMEVLDNTTNFALKDTVIVPFGGYTVIRFVADNPGWWLLHCHIEIHQLEGMAAVIRETSRQESSLKGSHQLTAILGVMIAMLSGTTFI